MKKLRAWLEDEINLLGVGLSICLGVLFLMIIGLVVGLIFLLKVAAREQDFINNHCQFTGQTKIESGVRIHNAVIGKTIIAQPIPYEELRRLYNCDDGTSRWH